MKKKIQKPFDLEKVKNGARIETRDGKPVRIICYDRKSRYPIVALVNYEDNENCRTYTIEGSQYYDGPTEDDLVIVEEVEVSKFNPGDWVFAKNDRGIPWLITTVTPGYYEVQDTEGHKDNVDQTTIDNDFRLWAPKDAKPGDVLCYQDGRPFMLKELDCFGYPIAYFGINTIDKICEGDGSIWTYDKVRPATFREYNSLFKQLRKENYEYNVDTHEITKQEIAWRNNDNVTITGYYILRNSRITYIQDQGNIKENYNIFATEKQAKSALAMARISQIMANDKRFGGVVTDKEWDSAIPYFVIAKVRNMLVTTVGHRYEYLGFHTMEQANLFLQENEDLVKDYYMMD